MNTRLKISARLLAAGILLCLLAACSIVTNVPQSAREGKPADTVRELTGQFGAAENMPPFELSYLCDAYGKLKDYRNLFACFDAVQAKISRGEHVITGNTYRTREMALGDLNITLRSGRSQAYLELGRYEEAIQDAQKGIDFLDAYHPSERFIFLPGFYSTLGLAYARTNQPDKARDYARRLGANADNWLRCGWHSFSSSVYSAVGDYRPALGEATKYEECLAPRLAMIASPTRKMLTGYTAEHAEIALLFLVGKTNLEVGNIAVARAKFDELLGRTELAQNRGLYWIILFQRGRIAESAGNPEEALRFYSRAVEVIEETRATLNIEANKIGFAGDKQDVYAAIVGLLFRRGDFAGALAYVERGKARALVDMLASKTSFAADAPEVAGAGDAPRTAALLKELDEAERKSLVLAYQDAPGSVAADIRSVAKTKLTQIETASKELASLVTIRTTGVREIQALLPQGETLVEYFQSGDTLLAFVVRPGSVKGVRLDGRGLAEDVLAFRRLLLSTAELTRGQTSNARPPGAGSGPSPQALRESGRALYARLFKPLEPLIGGRNVTIVSHGPLHYVPFNALSTDTGYLIDTLSLRVLPSASVLQYLRARGAGGLGELIAFGNPDMSDPHYDLPFAQSEVLAITQGNPQAKALLRKQASKEAVRRFSGQFRYVHFACHGLFNPDKPLESGLLLAGDSRDAGMLTVNELYDMRLQADLVTLSACETALGRVSNGDDVVGLTRGFLYAGASSIVSSLWQVEDKATALLMQEFYKNLKTMNKREALCQAQRKVKDAYNAHPFFWAAFQLTGSVE